MEIMYSVSLCPGDHIRRVEFNFLSCGAQRPTMIFRTPRFVFLTILQGIQFTDQPVRKDIWVGCPPNILAGLEP